MSLSKVCSVLLLGWLSTIVPTSGQVTLSSSLDAGQRFACPGERVTYICIGPDPLSLYAPPLRSRNNRAVFFTSDTPGQTGFEDGPLTITLLSVTSNITGLLSIDATNISLINLEVVCENGVSAMNMSQVDADDVKNVTDCSSDSMDGDFYSGVMKSTWTAPKGNIDVDCYEVLVFKNNIQIMAFNTTSTSMTVTYSGTVGDIVYASINVISKCGEWSGAVETNRVSLQLSGSVVATIVFMLIFLVSFVAVLIALIVVLVK